MTSPANHEDQTAVRREQRGDVLVLVIDNPPVNASSAAVRAGLVAGVEWLTAAEGVVGAVVVGCRGAFVSGSDLTEFTGDVPHPLLPAVIEAIEACPKPVVAAIDGYAMGGGLELALGCDARVATTPSRLGLPEVTLGMVPGGGGTQRLPRLAGRAASIDLIVSGRRVDGTAAHRLGIVDELAAPDDLLDRAVQIARSPGAKQPVTRRPVPDEDPDEVAKVAARALRGARGNPGAAEAVRLVMLAGDTSIDKALAEERRVFDDLRGRPEAMAMRYLFFAERAARKVEGLDAVVPHTVERAGVVGAGTMGVGIATAFVQAGIETTLVDQDAEVLAGARAGVERRLARAAARAGSPSAADGAMMARLRTGDSTDLLADTHLVVEAIVERLEAKVDLLQTLDQILPESTVLASNTSYLDLDELATATTRPHAVVGLHFFNPADVMRLLEVVRGAATSPETLRTALALAERLGKQPVVAGVGEGFIGNRVYAAYRQQCEFMLEEGALPHQIDRALVDFGFAMGPFAVGDLSGLDIAWAMRKARGRRSAAKTRYVEIPDLLCEAGRLGRKTDAGYYDYPSEGERGVPSPEVEAVIESCSARKGITRRRISDEEIISRAVYSMVNEASMVLEAGVARRPGDIDVAMVHGYGFPRHRGGPLWWASRQPEQARATAFELLAKAGGQGFRVGPVEDVLRVNRGSD